MTDRKDKSTQSRRQRPPQRPLRLYSFLGAATVTALLFASAFFLPVKEKEEGDASNEYQSTLLPITALARPQSLPDGDEALENIYAWVDLKSSTSTNTSDSPLLFSSYSGSLQPYHYTQLGQHEVKETSFFDDKMVGMLVEDTLEARRKSMPIPWETQIVLTEPEAIPFTPPKGIFWLNADGLVVSNPPSIDTKEAMEALGSQESILPTKLEYSPIPGMKQLRIVIRQSCGVAKLDELAVRALRTHLNTFDRNRQFQRNRLPISQGLLTILWYMR
ncbi:MAG: hypothetical protein IKP00_07435 [Victivallales bacterium]|nr:hypothetical protein [Victivallales bacterium]